MAAEIPTKEPTQIRAGDSITWIKTLNDYPATDGWVLHYRLINSAGKFDITATASGSVHLVSVSAATSATYTAGNYTLISWVTLGSDRYSINSEPIEVLPDLAAQASGYDTRSTAQKTLDLLDAAMQSQGSNAWVQEYEIEGRRMKFRSVGEFMAFRSKVKQEVIKEQNAERLANGLGLRNKINVRM